MRRSPSLLIRALALAALLPAGGCLVLSGAETVESGVRVSPSTLSQVEPGVTTEAWLLAALGEPTSRCAVEGSDRVEVPRYEYQKRRSSGGTVFLLLAGARKAVTRSVAYFEVTQGIVSRCWLEG
jgi:hypothetical protein